MLFECSGDSRPKKRGTPISTLASTKIEHQEMTMQLDSQLTETSATQTINVNGPLTILYERFAASPRIHTTATTKVDTRSKDRDMVTS